MIKTYDQTSSLCTDCGSREIIQDGGSGEIVCKDCGLVLSEIAVNMGPERQAFSFKEIENRTRTGLPVRFSLPDIGLSTTFRPFDVKGETRFEMYRLKKWNQISTKNTHRNNLSVAMLELDRLCSRLNLPQTIQEETAINVRKALKKGLAQGRGITSLTAASIYIVCRMNQIPRTLDEVSYHSHIDRKQIAQYYRMLLRELDLRVPIPKAKYGVSRIAAVAGLSENTQRKAIEILGEAERLKITVSKVPMGMAAAALYLACLINYENCTQKMLAEASGVSEVTIRNRYKELKRFFYPNILKPERG
ncbi:hypothetical protein ES703_89318 [subsurface metagenome]